MTRRWACAALMALVAVAAWQVWIIPESGIRMAVGPSLVPALVVAALTALVLAFAGASWNSHQADATVAEPGASRRVLSLLGGGVAFCAGVPWLGFVIPATACGMGVAHAFDAPLGVRSAAICGTVSLLFWLLFARLLGVGLGPALPWGI